MRSNLILVLAGCLASAQLVSAVLPRLRRPDSEGYVGHTIQDQRSVGTQIQTLKQHGYNIDRLDNHTQLKTFLYTWLAMERGEGGWCKWFPATDARNLKPGEVGKRAICFDEDYCPGQIKKACCSGWTPVMALCTKDSWYNGAEKASIRKTISELSRIMKQ